MALRPRSTLHVARLHAPQQTDDFVFLSRAIYVIPDFSYLEERQEIREQFVPDMDDAEFAWHSRCRIEYDPRSRRGSSAPLTDD